MSPDLPAAVLESPLHFSTLMKRTLTLGAMLAALSLSAGLAMILTSCSTLRNLNIENPRYSIRDIRPRVDVALPLSASSIDIDFNIEVDNPNEVGLNLDQIDFDLLINERRVLETVSQHDIRIPANGRRNVALTTRLDYNSVRTLWSELTDIIRGQRARYEIRGDAYYNTPIGRMKFPVTVYSTR